MKNCTITARFASAQTAKNANKKDGLLPAIFPLRRCAAFVPFCLTLRFFGSASVTLLRRCVRRTVSMRSFLLLLFTKPCCQPPCQYQYRKDARCFHRRYCRTRCEHRQPLFARQRRCGTVQSLYKPHSRNGAHRKKKYRNTPRLLVLEHFFDSIQKSVPAPAAPFSFCSAYTSRNSPADPAKG